MSEQHVNQSHKETAVTLKEVQDKQQTRCMSLITPPPCLEDSLQVLFDLCEDVLCVITAQLPLGLPLPPWALGWDSCFCMYHCLKQSKKVVVRMNKPVQQRTHTWTGSKVKQQGSDRRIGSLRWHTHTLLQAFSMCSLQEKSMLCNVQVATCKQVFHKICTRQSHVLYFI